jgi:hypothetical protein
MAEGSSTMPKHSQERLRRYLQRGGRIPRSGIPILKPELIASEKLSTASDRLVHVLDLVEDREALYEASLQAMAELCDTTRDDACGCALWRGSALKRRPTSSPWPKIGGWRRRSTTTGFIGEVRAAMRGLPECGSATRIDPAPSGRDEVDLETVAEGRSADDGRALVSPHSTKEPA